MRRPVAYALMVLVVAGGGCGGSSLPMGAKAEACGGCHVAQFAAWASTPHARSVASPVFQALLPRVEAAWGVVARRRCQACHAPGFGGDATIGCVACHAAVGNRGEANGALVVDLDAPLAAATSFADASPAHRTEVRGLLRSSSLCGTCHEVHGPALFLETTLTEARAAGDPPGGCAGCHMREEDSDRHAALAGVDPPWGASASVAAVAAERARALLARAITVEALPGDPPRVRARQIGGGHEVPTGAAFLRDLWIDVRIVDASGQVTHLARVMELGALPTRGDRPVALPTDADAIIGRGLAPGESRSIDVPRPAGAARPLSFEATLHARAFRADVLDALGLGDRAGEVPDLVVASARLTL